ncbi:glycosyltransferase family 4 protein, partial [candidate division KSB1 bacterium]|nr:glycosyltransferase family 4 protein [candidate division KSB1 bacterium]
MKQRKKAHILAINWQDITHPLSGGAEVHLYEIGKRLVDRGYDLTILCSRYRGAASEERVDGMRIIRRSNRALFNFSVPAAYRHLRRRFTFELVIDDINKIPFFTPLFVREPVLALVHHLFQKSIFLETTWPAAAYVYRAEKLLPRVYRRTPFAAVSESTRQELRELGIRTPIDLLPNGVDLDSYTVESTLAEKPTIGYLGRLKRYKCIHHFLQALPAVIREVPDLRVQIIG